MEVVMVSIYIDPVVSSWTTLLALMLEIPVVATILMDLTSMDMPWLVCVGSGISTQATTSVQPWGSLDSRSTINAFIGGDVGSEEVFGKQTGSLMGITWKNGQAIPLGLSILVGWEISPAVGILSTLLAGGAQHQAKYSSRGLLAAACGSLYLKVLQYISLDDIYEFLHGLNQLSYTLG